MIPHANSSPHDRPGLPVLVGLGLPIVVAVTALAVSARISVPVPGSPVPQSLQTLAVVLVGAFLGPVRGGVATAAYLLVGAVGLGVFADGASGYDHLVGPTAGYLLGFVVAAVVVGWGAERTRVSVGRAFLVMAAGHAIVLTLGWVRLGAQMGAGEAFAAGVTPFVWGGVVKSLAAAIVWVAWCRWRESVNARVRSPAAAD